IKVLPSHSAMNADMKARFEREARTISSLNHPNVCTLHDVGHENGVDFLVMEFLEGEPLDEHLKHSKFDTEQALEIGAQIAGALDAAHRKGLVHRDLKPSNIFLTREGAKLLDFGLAKLQAEAVRGMDDETRTTPVTGVGAIVGTLQYMSPEQLEGKEADARSDIFSFGATMYEMATGQRAFSGDSKASLIGSIMKEEPRAISEIQPTSPPALDRLIKKCLQKDPDDRWQSAKDLKDELDWIASAGSQAGIAAPVTRKRRLHLRLSWSLFALAGAAAVLLGLLYFSRTEPVRKTSRFTVSIEGRFPEVQWPRISPDGRLLAFRAADSTGNYKIWIRPLNSLDAYPLAGTEGAYRPFWSPDSRYLAFFVEMRLLKKILVSGGPPQLICEFQGVDGCWGDNGAILFDNGYGDPIMQVPAAGGVPTAATTVNEEREEQYHMWPWFLPDGNHFLYLVGMPQSPGILKVGSLDGSIDKELLLSDSRVEYCEPGYILYCAEGVLLARRFDLDRLEIVGEPIPIAEDIATMGTFLYHFSASDDATVVYQRATAVMVSRIIVVNRAGRELDTIGKPARYGAIALSPDGKRLAFGLTDPQTVQRGIWIHDLIRGVNSRLTFSESLFPVWSPDGERIAYGSVGTGGSEVMICRSDGAGSPSRAYYQSHDGLSPTDWSNDGQSICANIWQEDYDIVLLDPADSSSMVSVLNGRYYENQGSFSPDGKFLAYQCRESGRLEVYVRELGETQGKWQISSSGGSTPLWRADGKELYYWDGANRLVAVPVEMEGGHMTFGAAKQLFHRAVARAPASYRKYYDVSAEGDRFYLTVPASDDGQIEFVVVQGWNAELEE
ncbi:MAG: serine/threonine-protein kinase, partial [Candidatus Zixiibacteriota bacterium]